MLHNEVCFGQLPCILEDSLQGVDHKGAFPLERGVPLSPGTLQPYKFSQSDFYCDRDDVMRGCTIGGPPGPGSLLSKDIQGPCNEVNCLSDQLAFLGFPAEANHRSIVQPSHLCGQAAEIVNEKFHEGDTPPVPPTSKHFCLEATRMHIKSDSPHSIGNGALDFLLTQVIASVSKVRRQKYSIKTDVFLGNIMCSIKVRVWSTSESKDDYVVEFRRRSGDPFAFGDVYWQACRFFTVQFPSVCRVSDPVGPQFLPPPPPIEGLGCGKAELAPLLEMFAAEYLPGIQAEGVSTLAKIVLEDAGAACALCETKQTFDTLEKLFMSNRLEIMYPAARLFAALAGCKEATQHIAEHSILKIAIERLATENTDQIVRQELAKAVSAALRQCAVMISEEKAEELRLCLETSLDKLRVDSKYLPICSSLQDALLELNQYC